MLSATTGQSGRLSSKAGHAIGVHLDACAEREACGLESEIQAARAGEKADDLWH